jgi:opacity protein-like surface antigen
LPGRKPQREPKKEKLLKKSGERRNKENFEYIYNFNLLNGVSKMKITFVYYSLFLLAVGILLFARPISAQETNRVLELKSDSEERDRIIEEERDRILEEETERLETDRIISLEAERRKWLPWFKKENLSVKGSSSGGRIRHETGDYYSDINHGNGSPDQVLDMFTLSGRSIWGGEFGIGYKIPYGIELGVSYMFMELNDWSGRTVDILQGVSPPEWEEQINMDLASRAVMFNVRAYLDDLTGIEMGRFSLYILGSVGQARHKVSDFKEVDNDSPYQTFNYYTVHRHDAKGQLAYRLGMGTLFRLTDHFSIDASASFMDWGEARASRHFQGTRESLHRTYRKPHEIDVRTVQATVGIQFNF